MNIIAVITEWPVIIQGALGSALFWLIIEIGQWATRKFSSKIGEDHRTANWFSLAAHEAPIGNTRESARFFCIYGSIHYIVKALIIAVISTALSPLLNTFSSAGYMISAYFLFRALSFVPHTRSHGNLEERKRRFEENAKNPIAKT